MSAPAFLTETRERFLKAILAQLPVERIRELYLFQPIKQGGVESGVAVVAAWPEGVSGAPGTTSEVAGRESGAPLLADEAQADAQVTEQGLIVPVEEPPAVALEEVTGDAAETDGCALPATRPDADGDSAAGAGRPDAAAGAAAEVVAEEGTGSGESSAPDSRPRTPDVVQNAPDEKYTVYSARYRHVLKGPDRGKWEASVVAEADAPLISIETVVRGVQRRAGDVEGPDHMTADDLRAALRLGPASDAE